MFEKSTRLYRELTNARSRVEEELTRDPILRSYSYRRPISEGLSSFYGRIGRASLHIVRDPEVLLFAFLQWVCIIIGYFVWVQGFAMIPEGAEDNTLLNVLFFCWSLLVVGVLSLPLGILSGAIGASFFFRALRRDSTISKCLQASTRRYLQLWMFSWLDNWLTVTQILERLPKERDDTPISLKLIREVLYYAWKCATLAIIPAVLLGKGIADAAGQSFAIFTSRLKETVLLRAGYSAWCWVVGVITYLVVLLLAANGLIPLEETSLGRSALYWFYFYAGFPVVIGTGIVQIALRPVFIIASCELYVDYLRSGPKRSDTSDD